MIEFLWFHTYWFPAIIFMGGLIASIWFVGKVAFLIEYFGSRITRNLHSVDSKHDSNNF